MRAYCLINDAVVGFEEKYGVLPNVIMLGSAISHEVWHLSKYTMIWKPIKVDERGKMTFQGIPIEVDYERPDSIVVGLIEGYR